MIKKKVLAVIPARAGSKRIPNKNIRKFLAAVFKESVDVDLGKLWDLEGGQIADRKTNELAPLVDLIAAKLNLSS